MDAYAKLNVGDWQQAGEKQSDVAGHGKQTQTAPLCWHPNDSTKQGCCS
jgi:hypothetical protein